MKKIGIITLASLLIYGTQKSAFTMFSTKDRTTVSTNIINEAIFINVIRDLELLNSWLLNNYYPQETVDKLRHQNYQKILALYGLDPQIFKENLKYYLEDTSKKALKIYEKVYLALEALSI